MELIIYLAAFWIALRVFSTLDRMGRRLTRKRRRSRTRRKAPRIDLHIELANRVAASGAATSSPSKMKMSERTHGIGRVSTPSEYSSSHALEAGLVIRESYISQILSGEKTWEMRSRGTQRRGPIALIAQGTGKIVGVAKLVDVLPQQTDAQMMGAGEKHRIPLNNLHTGKMAKWRIPWVLEDAWRLPIPVRYIRKPGAVTWVLVSEREAMAVLDQLPAGWVGGN